MGWHVIKTDVFPLETVALHIGDKDNFAESALGINHFFIPYSFPPIESDIAASSGFGYISGGGGFRNKLILIVLHFNLQLNSNVLSD